MRIARACRELGIVSVAVYSDVDRASLHVSSCDEAFRLGPAPASQSYLRGDLVLDIARRCGADAIHPGYGFLSENAAFAAQCETASVKFVGPPAAAMRALGSKTAARQLADRVGMPRVPGTSQGLQSEEEAIAAARSIGYPVMLKAAAGGGGKGMRRVDEEAELLPSLRASRGEALSSFGSDEVYVEKLVIEPRHIEIQILADEHGNCISLGERECSIQRRNQKVIEEAPSAVVGPDLRRRMGEAAVKLAKAAGYTNAGTVEFLLDKDEKFYFLEVNTRLQVEHPVTELVTGLDLVHLQLHIAQGRPLPLTQRDVTIRGHAMECRIYAEDPENNFFPSPGKITKLKDAAGPGIRLDSGVYEGWTVPLDYDPMLAKLIAFAPDRSAAIQRLLRALDETFVGGIRTNLPLFQSLLRDENFRAARMHTGYLDANLKTLLPPATGPNADAAGLMLPLAAIAAAQFLSQARASLVVTPAVTDTQAGGWARQARAEGLRR